MFDQLYVSPVAVSRHRSGPLLKERLAFLARLRDQGYTPNGLRKKARGLLVIIRLLGLTSRSRKTLTFSEVKRKTANKERLCSTAVEWLRLMGRLRQRAAPLTLCEKKIKAFADYLEREAELSPVTISGHCWWVRRFFAQLRVKGGSLHEVTPRRIDMAFQKLLEPGGYSRQSIRGCAMCYGLSFVLRNRGDGVAKDWPRPFTLHGSTRRNRCRWDRRGTMCDGCLP